jgi:hypothetical protein
MFELDDNAKLHPPAFQITTLSSLYKPASVAALMLPFSNAVKFFSEHIQATGKDKVSMYSGALYGPVKHRADVNVISISAGIVDFDNKSANLPTLPKDHHDNLDGLVYFWHSTFSNTKYSPKWRLIIPLERPATLQEWPFVVNGILQLLGGNDPNIDLTCFEISRAFYVPSYPAEHAEAAFSGYSDGKEVFHVRSN